MSGELDKTGSGNEGRYRAHELAPAEYSDSGYRGYKKGSIGRCYREFEMAHWFKEERFRHVFEN